MIYIGLRLSCGVVACWATEKLSRSDTVKSRMAVSRLWDIMVSAGSFIVDCD